MRARDLASEIATEHHLVVKSNVFELPGEKWTHHEMWCACGYLPATDEGISSFTAHYIEVGIEAARDA